MLDSKNLRENIDTISSNLKKRKFILDKSKFLSIDKDRKEIIVDTENLKNKRNVLSKEIGILKSKNEDAGSILKKVEEINNTLDLKQGLLENAETQYNNFLLDIPNILDDSVPIGNSDKDNKVIKYSNDKNLEILNKNSNFKDHSDIGKSLKLYDQEIAAKISSSRFSLLFGELASLHRAVAQFMINEHINHNGYTEVNVPLIVNSDSLLGTGQLPKFKDDLFEIKNKKDFFLIPTAEVPLTNIFRDIVLLEDDLPVKYTSLSSCFRSEAGSYGKDTKGLIRQHQFEKVELVNGVNPSTSDESLELLVNSAEKILDLLNLPYRKILLCSGDTGFSSSKTYDLEVWMPSQNSYREVSSCSNFKDFQSRRLNAKYKNKISKKKQFIHTLNGSGLAVGRTLAAIIENFQNNNGDIEIPEILRPYMNNSKIIKKSS
jgi:seryl-tRNA synthetase|tara:strand:- start:11682 stop:12977 length:1296 start_codon:yes stop_codon:yes gene_type:complete